MDHKTISIVIPVYNEEERIKATLQQIQDYVIHCDLNIEVIIVNDGSNDNTVKLIETIKKDFHELILVDNKVNKGKGGAVRDGMLHARGDYVLFTDADLSTPMKELDKLLLTIEKGYDIAIGSRRMKESRIPVPQPFHRRLMGLVFQKIVAKFIINGFKDTQCGFKLFTAGACKKVFGQLLLNGFAFDIEALYLANILGYKTIEVPVEWNDAKGSKVQPVNATLNMIKELIYMRLFYSLYYSKVYDRYMRPQFNIRGEGHVRQIS